MAKRWLWLCVVWQLGLQLIMCQYFTREDIRAPGFDWSQWEVEQRFFKYSQECSHIRERQEDKRGDPVNNTVTGFNGHDVDIRTYFTLFSIHYTQTKTQRLL